MALCDMKVRMSRRKFPFYDLNTQHDICQYYRSASILPYAIVPRCTGTSASTQASQAQQADAVPGRSSHERLFRWLMSTTNTLFSETIATSVESEDAAYTFDLDLNNPESEPTTTTTTASTPTATLANDSSTVSSLSASSSLLPLPSAMPDECRGGYEEVVFLLGAEVRPNGKPIKRAEPKTLQIQESDIYWSDFGGKREPDDRDPIDTALREFDEETSHIFADHLELIRERMESDQSLKLWQGAGMSVQFLVEVPFLEGACETFYQRFSTYVRSLQVGIEERIKKVLSGESVQTTDLADLFGTLNKCAIRWINKSDFQRVFDTVPPMIPGRSINSSQRLYEDSPCCLTLIEWRQRSRNFQVFQQDSVSSLSTSSAAGSPLESPRLRLMNIFPFFAEYLRMPELRRAIDALPKTIASACKIHDKEGIPERAGTQPPKKQRENMDPKEEANRLRSPRGSETRQHDMHSRVRRDCSLDRNDSSHFRRRARHDGNHEETNQPLSKRKRDDQSNHDQQWAIDRIGPDPYRPRYGEPLRQEPFVASPPSPPPVVGWGLPFPPCQPNPPIGPPTSNMNLFD